MRSSTLVLAEAGLRLGSIRLAARALGQSPSGCSEALSALEDTLGLVLARRNPDGLALTIEGERALPLLGELSAALRALRPDSLTGPRGVTLEALFRVLCVLDQGSIRRTARQLGIGQPQLSRQLAQVEAALGARLAVRDEGGITPTEAGERLRTTLARIEEDWRALASLGTRPAPRVRRHFSLGAVIPASPEGELANMLGDLFRRLLLTRGLKFSLVSTLAEDLLTGLDSGRFDCVFLDARVRDRYYEQKELRRGPVALCGVPPGWAGMDDPSALRALLRACPLILQSRRSGLRQRTEAFLDLRLGPDWRAEATVIEMDSLPIVLNVVAKGGLISVLPHTLARDAFPEAHVLLPEAYDQRILLTWRKIARSRAIADLIGAELDDLLPARAGEPGAGEPGADPVAPSVPS
jgi:DNA-binding transcriptional LysR family regulator